MERTWAGPDAGAPRPSRHAERHLSLTTQPEPAAADHNARSARGSTGIVSASWRERVRSRFGVEELLTFHVGRERFATCLASIEEAVEHPDVYRVPEMP